MDAPTAGLIGGTVGAIIGATANYLLAKPKPAIQVLDVLIDPMQSDDKRALAREIFMGRASYFFITPQDVYNLAKKLPYVQTPQREYQHGQLYSFWLYETIRDVTRTRIIHAEMPRIVTELRTALAAGLLEDFFSLWAEYDRIFIPHIQRAKSHGTFDLAGPTCEDLQKQNLPLKHDLSVDADGDYWVLVGTKKIIVQWSNIKEMKNLMMPLSSRLAAAFATENIPALKKVQSLIDTIAWNDPNLDSLETLARGEIVRMSRIVVRGVVSNAGRSPVSLSGEGTLTLRCGQFSYATNDQGGNRIVPDDLNFAMHLVDKEYIAQLPSVELPGGGVREFTAVSNFYLHELDEQLRNDVVKVYGSDRCFTLSLRRLDTDERLYSSERAFRHETKKNAELAPAN